MLQSIPFMVYECRHIDSSLSETHSTHLADYRQTTRRIFLACGRTFLLAVQTAHANLDFLIHPPLVLGILKRMQRY